jgi:hypothetical protein
MENKKKKIGGHYNEKSNEKINGKVRIRGGVDFNTESNE